MCMKQIIKYYPSGSKQKEYYIDDNEHIQGEFTTYFENGLPKSVHLYQDNNTKGPIKLWYNTGHLQKVVDRTIEINGYNPTTEYNSAGFITYELVPNIDRPGLIHRTFTGTTQQLCQCEYFTDKEGRKQGSAITRFDSGLLQSVASYLDGNLHGEIKHYFDVVEFDEDGKPKLDCQILNSIYQYKNGDRHGDSIEYHRNGQIAKKMQFKHNRRIGIYQEFAHNGVLAYETVYDAKGNQSMYEKRFAPDTSELVYYRIFDSEYRSTEEHRFTNKGLPIEMTSWEYRGYSKFCKEIKRYESGNLVYHITYDNSIPRRTSYTELEYNGTTGFRKAINEVRNTEESSVSLKFHFSEDGKPRRISLIVDGKYQTTDFKKLLKKKTSEIDEADIAYIKLTYF